MLWVADFETTTGTCEEMGKTSHVWAVGLCEVGNPTNKHIMNTMNEFLTFCEKRKSNDVVYFHNMRFDGNFIVQHLLRNGFTHALTNKDVKSKTFKTIISDTSLWYQIEIYFKVNGRNVNKVTIHDSLKLIPLGVSKIVKAFKLNIKKGKIDYSAHNYLPEGSELTLEEKEYIENDILIVEHAVNFFHENGLNKMTIGACALSDFIDTIGGQKMFKMYFPKVFNDADIRKTYKGGFVYLVPKFRSKALKDMIVLDRNSMYPAVMAGCNGEILPYGTPIYYEGEYEQDDMYPLYVQKIRCSFNLKPGKLPTIQIKENMYYQGSKSGQYLTTSDDEIVTLYLTSVDLKLFLENYDTQNLTYEKGWKFKGIPAGDIFGTFVKKWSDIKIKAKEEGNDGLYLISKLMMNNLSGKFGTAVKVKQKIPYIGKDNALHFKTTEPEFKEGVYIAMACFITAYARYATITAAQKIMDAKRARKLRAEFVYADTDSLHIVLNGDSIEKVINFLKENGLDIHPTRLGAWDIEAVATQGKFIRSKCYVEKHIISEDDYNKAMEDEDEIHECYTKEADKHYYFKITVAGMPDSCYKHVTFDNFKEGAVYPGKLAHRTVYGGVILENIDFTINK